MNRYLTFIFILASTCLIAQKKRDVVKIEPIITYTKSAHLSDAISIGYELTHGGGKVMKTQGIAQGKFKWKKLVVSSKNATFSEGRLSYNRGELWSNESPIVLKVSSKKTPSTFVEHHITLPRIEKVLLSLEGEFVDVDHPVNLSVSVALETGEQLKLPWKEAKHLLDIQLVSLIRQEEDQLYLSRVTPKKELKVVVSSITGNKETLIIPVHCKLRVHGSSKQIDLQDVESITLRPQNEKTNFDKKSRLKLGVALKNGLGYTIDDQYKKDLVKILPGDYYNVVGSDVTFEEALIHDKITVNYRTILDRDKSFDVLVDYSVHLDLEFNGNNGRKGRAGYSGDHGGSEYEGSYSRRSDANHGDGEDGEDGRDGEDGQDAQHVVLTFQGIERSSDTLFQVNLITSTGYTSVFYMNPKNSRINLSLIGGNGGDGGEGGRGGDGVNETKEACRGYGGNGGDGGHGGAGGNGGDLEIRVPRKYKKLMSKSLVQLNFDGGTGGAGGRRGGKGYTGDKLEGPSLWDAVGLSNGTNGDGGTPGKPGQKGRYRITYLD